MLKPLDQACVTDLLYFAELSASHISWQSSKQVCIWGTVKTFLICFVIFIMFTIE